MGESVMLLAVAAVLVVVAVSALAPKVGVASPVLLVVVGLAASYLPGMPEIELEPDWFLMIVLPPLLYAAAVNMPATDFRRDFKTIGALSVGLVLVSTFASGLLIHWLVPQVGLAASIAIGAVVSPPDAVAATSIGRRLGLPERLVTILEGEGLVNDATALVLLRSAIGATAGAVSLWGVVGDFAFAVAVGAAVGALIGCAGVWVRGRLDDPVLTTSVSFVVPFLAYFPAEELGASGVLAVVAAGIITGTWGARKLGPHDRVTDRTNWRTISHLLESGVFLLMGYQIHALVQDAIDDDLDVGFAVGIGALVTALLILVRVAFVVPLVLSLRRAQRRGAERVQTIEGALERIEDHGFRDERSRRAARRILGRRHADASFHANEGLGWRGGAVLAWSGMRGAVTIAAAQSLPADVAYRPGLMLVAFTVAILTLVGHGTTLPALISRLGVRGTTQEEAAREVAALLGEITADVRRRLDRGELRRDDGTAFDEDVVAWARDSSLPGIATAENDWDEASGKLHQRIELRRIVTDLGQACLLDARASGVHRSSTIRRVQHLLDISVAGHEGPSH